MDKETFVSSSFYRIISLHLLFIILSGIAFYPEASTAQKLDVPYVATPEPVVESMLDLAEVDSCDYVIDLGSGDGRIVIAAAQRGAVGHGVDIDPQRNKEATANARAAGVSDRVMFFQENLFDTEISQADVVTMYLLSSINLKLRPRLLNELLPGARVVSHTFSMGDWKPDVSKVVETANSFSPIYLWIIPAKADGSWNWTIGKTQYNMKVKQKYQTISIQITTDGNPLHISKSDLRGARMTIRASDGKNSFLYNGKIDSTRISGLVQIRTSSGNRIVGWNAYKQQ